MTNDDCPLCGSPYGEFCGCYYADDEYPSSNWTSSYEKGDDLNDILQKIYDLHKDPSYDRSVMGKLLDSYKTLTGQCKPGFLP